MRHVFDAVIVPGKWWHVLTLKQNVEIDDIHFFADFPSLNNKEMNEKQNVILNNRLWMTLD